MFGTLFGALFGMQTRTLENLARKLPPGMARLAKRCAVHGRYRKQLEACRAGFREYGDRYPRKVLFVAGLPKSGTTWLEKMLGAFPGFHEVLIPEVARHEMATGGSHDFELPDDMFERFRDMLVLTKMHVHGSPHNCEVLKRAGVRYVALHRDLRDVAVSNYFYVCNTPWHPEYPHYAGKSVEQGLEVFARRTLPAYVDWVRSWHANRDPEASLIFRYEDMLEDAASIMGQVNRHFELGASDDEIASIVERHSFRQMSGGRDRGEADGGSFVRKGVAGDWRTQFTPELTSIYRQVLGAFLIEYGYEESETW
ncbi:MAG: sulfotransferase domain-containing protein [Phycisphaerales bacterium]|nr:sulfotransferase domain-containing protein [Phycisphaerales bacterium]